METPFNRLDSPLPLDYYEQKYCISRATLWRYRKAGLPALHIGAKTFVRESDFIRFLEQVSNSGSTSAAGVPAKEAR